MKFAGPSSFRAKSHPCTMASAKVVYVSLMMLFAVFFSGFELPPAKAASTSFGTDYHTMTTTAGSPVDTGTTIAIPILNLVSTNYVVDPYTAGSTRTGMPSDSTPSGYGWRTADVVGRTLSAGTWTFKVTTQSSTAPASLGDAHVRVYVYSTDKLGSNISLIGTANGTNDNVLPACALTCSPVTSNLSFSTSSSIDLTDRILVVEYWISASLSPAATTITFQTVDSSTTVKLPDNTTYYLSTPRLQSIGLSESVPVSESGSRSYNASRPLSTAVTIDEQLNNNSVSHTYAIGDTVAISDSFQINISPSTTSSLGVSDTLAQTYSANKLPEETLAVADSLTQTFSSYKSPSETVTALDSISVAVTRSPSSAMRVRGSSTLATSTCPS